jgi:dynein light chain Tctex-type 1
MADGYAGGDSTEFQPEDVESILKVAIVNVLSENSYNAKKVNEWTNAIVASTLKSLQELNRPFKYVISCIIMQNNGAGLNTSCSMRWDATKDGHCKVPWQNQTMNCIVTVYGVTVNIDDPQDDL